MKRRRKGRMKRRSRGRRKVRMKVRRKVRRKVSRKREGNVGFIQRKRKIVHYKKGKE